MRLAVNMQVLWLISGGVLALFPSSKAAPGVYATPKLVTTIPTKY